MKRRLENRRMGETGKYDTDGCRLQGEGKIDFAFGLDFLFYPWSLWPIACSLFLLTTNYFFASMLATKSAYGHQVCTNNTCQS